MPEHHRTDDPFADGPNSERTSTRRRRRQTQRDFELTFYSAILDRDPLNYDVLRAHADNLAAKGNYAQALQADLRLTRLRPERPIPWYNLACSYAQLGTTDKAFEALEEAMKLGYRDYGRLRRDPDLNPLRADPRFARLTRRA